MVAGFSVSSELCILLCSLQDLKGHRHSVEWSYEIRNIVAIKALVGSPASGRRRPPAITCHNCILCAETQARKKEHKPKLFSPDIFQWGRGLPREGVGAKEFDMSLETKEIKLFWRDIPAFCRDIPEVPEKFEKKKS